MGGERMTFRTLNGIPITDFPTLAKVRLTDCRRHGHHFGLDTDWCINCAAPWFFQRAERHHP